MNTDNKLYDVVVGGGGPAGICAAISASREGARTALIERYGIVGGNLTSGHVGPVMGGTAEGTISEEIHRRLNIVPRKVHSFEEAKIELALLLEEAGVDLYLQSTIYEVKKEGNKISSVRVTTHDGSMEIKGHCFIDCTGDGTIAALSGVPFEYGRDDGRVQPISLMFILGGVSADAIYCNGKHPNVQVPTGDFVEICKIAEKSGRLPKNVDTVRIFATDRSSERMINATQVNLADTLSSYQISQAESNLRKQIKTIHSFLKEVAPGYENSYVQSSASTAGIRESRRIQGEYTITDVDVESGSKFDDVVVHKANFIIDIHNPDGGGQAEGVAKDVQSYDIPYRAMLPKAVDGLLVAGRAISGTHRAHGSYRVMNICMPMGQAAGIAGALCAKQRTTPKLLNVKLLQDRLVELGIDLFSDKIYLYPFNPSD